MDNVVNQAIEQLRDMFGKAHHEVNAKMFPAGGLNRRTWNELRKSGNTSEMDALVLKHGMGRVKQWAIENSQRDSEGR